MVCVRVRVRWGVAKVYGTVSDVSMVTSVGGAFFYSYTSTLLSVRVSQNSLKI
jgi:hypothetical protein